MPEPTVRRIVMVRFKDGHRDPDIALAAASKAREVFPKIAGVQAIAAGVPADPDCAQEWDLLLEVDFASLDDVGDYRVDATHVAYVDEVLKPVMETLQARNFHVA